MWSGWWSHRCSVPPPAWLVARLSGAGAWLHVQDYEVEVAFETGLLKGTLLRRSLTAWEGWIMRRFDRVSTISSRMLHRAESNGVSRRRLVLFPNWADVDSAVQPPGPDLLRAELGLAPDAVVLLYSGTMGRKQGLEELGYAAEALRDATDLVFVFCGSGPTRAELEAQCRGLPNVRFLDLQPVERLGALLSMADIHLLPQGAGVADLVMPSKITGMLASGRPVVATCVEGSELAEVVRDRGLVVPAGDVSALVAAIRKLAVDKELRTRLGENARTYAQEHLSRDSVLKRFEAALVEVSRKRNG